MEREDRSSFVPAGRLDALVDAVLAITMTLLVLDLRLPEFGAKGLADALLGLRPKFDTWILSFLLLALLWSGHVRAFRRVERVDPLLFWLVILWLLTTSLLPFSSSLLGDFPQDPQSHWIYSANLLLVEIVIVLRNLQIGRLAVPAGDKPLGLAEILRRRDVWAHPAIVSACALASAAVAIRWPGHASWVYALLVPGLLWRGRAGWS